MQRQYIFAAISATQEKFHKGVKAFMQTTGMYRESETMKFCLLIAMGFFWFNLALDAGKRLKIRQLPQNINYCVEYMLSCLEGLVQDCTLYACIPEIRGTTQSLLWYMMVHDV
jgi:antibiotic biosynthesis monooxygenase (ABM) superfamily enzyme